jgi:hypothetical protein
MYIFVEYLKTDLSNLFEFVIGGNVPMGEVISRYIEASNHEQPPQKSSYKNP